MKLKKEVNMKFNSFIKMYSLLLIVSLSWVTQVNSQNLIMNPGCEDSLVNGEIPHWTEIVGNNWTRRIASPIPYEGSAYFFPGVAVLAELQQEVDVSMYAADIDNELLEFIFEGYVRSYPQSPLDQSRIVLEFLDSTKTAKLDSVDSGNYANSSAWVQISDTSIAPQGTRNIRIRLISTRRSGSNNDGYYDALSLVAVPLISSVGSKEFYSPGEFHLFQNYPNPFNPSTKISWQSPVGNHQTLKIYDILGKEVATLIDEFKPTGSYQVDFNAADLPSGVYMYRIQAGSFIETKKMILLR